ncbi:hypothetical protein [Streptomyces sp. ST2-7A]|uniref:hypothetical protein n=1 Tax=Streptomyces sp. ST2-7A TaxID=2907214 RepID=UPI001F2F0F2B|nr:hypothetical protein [Streptomyces sp. ST2-7A]MCE7081193.1 hypothetical protein [Streptomyces sp. ST2-7A]
MDHCSPAAPAQPADHVVFDADATTTDAAFEAVRRAITIADIEDAAARATDTGPLITTHRNRPDDQWARAAAENAVRAAIPATWPTTHILNIHFTNHHVVTVEETPGALEPYGLTIWRTLTLEDWLIDPEARIGDLHLVAGMGAHTPADADALLTRITDWSNSGAPASDLDTLTPTSPLPTPTGTGTSPDPTVGLNPTGRPRRSSAGTRRRKAKRTTALTRTRGSEAV